MTADETQTKIGRIENTLDTMRGDITDVKTNISDLAKAVVVLARVEERVALHHDQNQEGMERLGARVDKHEERLEKHEERIVDIEKSDTRQSTKIGFGERWFWLIVGVIASAMASFIIGKM